MNRTRWSALLMSAVFLVGSVWSGGPVRAAMMFTAPLRVLTAGSDVIVVAEPLADTPPHMPWKYRVIEVIRGAGLAAGDELVLDKESLSDHHYGFTLASSTHGKETEKPKGGINEKATEPALKMLLFLAYPDSSDVRRRTEKPDEFRMLSSGIRAVDRQGRLYVPEQFANPGPYHLTEKPELTWEKSLAEVRRDLIEIEGLHAIKRLQDPALRNRLIFRWLAKHEAELTLPKGERFFFGYSEKSWGRLDDLLFTWIMESCVAEDCWQALQLAKKLNKEVDRKAPSFGTEKSRAFLTGIAFDEKQPEAERLEALAWLGRHDTHWHDVRHPTQPYYATRFIDPVQQKELWSRLEPLLSHAEPKWRLAAAKAVAAINNPDMYSHHGGKLYDAVPRLLELYLKEDDAKVRDQIVMAIAQIQTHAYDSTYDENPQGIEALVIYRGQRGDKLRFEIIFRSPIKLKELPEFKYKSRSLGSAFYPDQRVTPELESPEAKPAEGWSRGSVFVTIPHKLFYDKHFSPEQCELRAVGKLGDTENHWVSAPVTFMLPPRPTR